MSPRLALPPPLPLALLALLPGLSLAACSDNGARDEVPAMEESAVEPEAPARPASHPALTPGGWTVEENADGVRAAFAEPGREPQLLLTCDRARRTITLTRAGEASEARNFILEAGGQQEWLEMEPASGGYTVELDAELPPFAALADPAETIRLTAEGTPSLALPTHPGLARVIEACR